MQLTLRGHRTVLIESGRPGFDLRFVVSKVRKATKEEMPKEIFPPIRREP